MLGINKEIVHLGTTKFPNMLDSWSLTISLLMHWLLSLHVMYIHHKMYLLFIFFVCIFKGCIVLCVWTLPDCPCFIILGSMRRPTAKYTKVGERLRHVIPSNMQCSMACGGRACKYENPSRWSDEEQALKGLYSSWYYLLVSLFFKYVPSSSYTNKTYICSKL